MNACAPLEPVSKGPTQKNTIPERSHEATATPPLSPPWERWNEGIPETPELQRGDQLLAQGQIAAAAEAYADAERVATSDQIKDEALARRAGALLRLGRSGEVLNLVSQRTHAEGRAVEDIPPKLAFIVAFAYESLHDLDQSLAWLSLAYRRARLVPNQAPRIQAETYRLIATLPDSTLEFAQKRWSEDPFITPVIRRERERRLRGAKPETDVSAAWFGRETSPPTEWSGGADTAGRLTRPPGEVAIGIILPFTGKFSAYAENVKRGIELAVERYTGPLKIALVTADTQGEEAAAVEAYDQVVQQGVTIVLGPLLVRDSESVAQRSQSVGIPFITFTKKSGVPELGPTVFRLGATAEDQMGELLQFAITAKHLQTFGVIVPDTEAGKELSDAFLLEAGRRGKQNIRVLKYTPGDEASVVAAVSALKVSPPAGIFIGDTLDKVQPIVAELQSAPEMKNVTLLGSALWNDSALLRGFGSLLDGAVFVAPFFASSANPLVTEFSEAFRAKYQASPDLLSAQAFDATNFALQHLDSADNSSPSLIRRLSGAAPLAGVTGQITVNEAGDLKRRMSVLTVHAGQAVEVMSAGTLTGYTTDEKTEDDEPPA